MVIGGQRYHRVTAHSGAVELVIRSSGGRHTRIARRSFPASEGVNRFLSDPVLMMATRKRAWKLGREMIWSVVAQRHMESFKRARASLSEAPRKAFAVQTLDNRPYQLPPLKLDHLLRMTDNTGIFQHAIFNVPNFAEGYCTDDNARAYILTLLLEETTSRVTQDQFERLPSIYLAFLWHAFDQETCRFRNFMSYQRQWLEREGSEDSHARPLGGRDGAWPLQKRGSP